jgi:hypothetical protein
MGRGVIKGINAEVGGRKVKVFAHLPPPTSYLPTSFFLTLLI